MNIKRMKILSKNCMKDFSRIYQNQTINNKIKLNELLSVKQVKYIDNYSRALIHKRLKLILKHDKDLTKLINKDVEFLQRNKNRKCSALMSLFKDVEKAVVSIYALRGYEESVNFVHQLEGDYTYTKYKEYCRGIFWDTQKSNSFESILKIVEGE